MAKYKVWDGKETLVTPVGKVFTAEEVRQKYPMANIPGFTFIVYDAPVSMGIFYEFGQMKAQNKRRVLSRLGVEDCTDVEKAALEAEYDGATIQEVLEMIEYIEDNPLPQEPTAEERIAAALEFQNLLAMPAIG